MIWLRLILCAVGLHTWWDSIVDGRWSTFAQRDCIHCHARHIRPLD